MTKLNGNLPTVMIIAFLFETRGCFIQIHYVPWQGHTGSLSKLLDWNISLHALVNSIQELASAAKVVEHEIKVNCGSNYWTLCI